MGKQPPKLDWHFCDEERADSQEWQTVLTASARNEDEIARRKAEDSANGLNRWLQGVVALVVLVLVALWVRPWQSASPAITPTVVALSKDTHYFVYRFQSQDADAVTTVAAQMDAVYSRMRKDLGLPPSGRQLTITVSVGTIQLLYMSVPGNGAHLTAPSPRPLPTHDDLSSAKILHQSLVYLLGEQVLAEKFAGYHSRPSLSEPFTSSWSPLIGALRLWQLWDANTPLATLQQDLVTWLYADTDAVLPDRYDHICALHQAWRLTPLMLSIPLTCTDIDPIGNRIQPPLDLPSLERRAVEAVQGLSEIEQRAQVIALETVFEYVVATYGREKLPVLIDQLSRASTWDFIVHTVFQTTLDEFQEGWRRYLAEHYAIGP